MKNYKLGLVFENQKELDAWIQDNLMVDGRQMYRGQYVMMVCMSSGEGDQVVLDEIWTC